MTLNVSARHSILFCLVCGICISPQAAHALAYVPSESEWLAWPDYCRARYVVSGAGVTSAFANRVPAAEVSRQEAQMAGAWGWLHHFCAALSYMTRADTETAERWVEHWLEEAEVNFMGYYQRIDKQHPMFIEVVTRIAQVHHKRGDDSTALQFLSEAMEQQSKAAPPYELASMIYRENGDLQEALIVLLKGNEATSGLSAEIHYFLGHLYIELNDFKSAVEHADRAYELGYPLPGLATKLRRLGYRLKSENDP